MNTTIHKASGGQTRHLLPRATWPEALELSRDRLSAARAALNTSRFRLGPWALAAAPREPDAAPSSGPAAPPASPSARNSPRGTHAPGVPGPGSTAGEAPGRSAQPTTGHSCSSGSLPAPRPRPVPSSAQTSSGARSSAGAGRQGTQPVHPQGWPSVRGTALERSARWEPPAGACALVDREAPHAGGRPECGGTWGGATPAPGSPGSTAPCRPGVLPPHRSPAAAAAATRPTALQPGTRSEPAAGACALGAQEAWRAGGRPARGGTWGRARRARGAQAAPSMASGVPSAPPLPRPCRRAGPAPDATCGAGPLALEAAVACSTCSSPAAPRSQRRLCGRCQGDTKVARVPPGAVPRIRRTDPALAASCDVDGGSRAVQGPSVRRSRCPKHEPLPPGPLGPRRCPAGAGRRPLLRPRSSSSPPVSGTARAAPTSRECRVREAPPARHPGAARDEAAAQPATGRPGSSAPAARTFLSADILGRSRFSRRRATCFVARLSAGSAGRQSGGPRSSPVHAGSPSLAPAHWGLTG
ncbi:uncharacterized protein LOC144309927 [Canis aureus]